MRVITCVTLLFVQYLVSCKSNDITTTELIIQEVPCPRGQHTDNERCCIEEWWECYESTQCCDNASCIPHVYYSYMTCQCTPPCIRKDLVPAEVIITIIVIGMIGLGATVLYMHLSTRAIKETEEPVPVVPAPGPAESSGGLEEIQESNPERDVTIKRHAKHIVEHLLRGSSTIVAMTEISAGSRKYRVHGNYGKKLSRRNKKEEQNNVENISQEEEKQVKIICRCDNAETDT